MARMTKEERDTKRYISNKLAAQGYPTYADIFSEFDLHLTSNPKVLGYMVPSKGYITINRDIDEDNFSVIIRHEILHFYLEHEQRMLAHLAKKHGLDYSKLEDMSIEDLKKELYRDKTFNFAGDYEISNRAYTEEDKETIRKLHALVTEDDHPGWEDLSVEEMYDKLMELKQKDKENALDDIEEKHKEKNPTIPEDNDEGEGAEGDGEDEGDDGYPTPSDDSDGSGEGDEDNDEDDGEMVDGSPISSDGNEENDEDEEDDGGDGTPISSDKNKEGEDGEDSDTSNDDEEENRPGDSKSTDNSSEEDEDSEDDSPKFVYGSFIDENTFLDSNGNPVSIRR